MYKNTGKLFDCALLEQIRDHFAFVDSDPLTGKRIFFENAGGSLTLRSVIDEVAKQVAIPDNAGRDNATSKEIGRLMAQGKSDIMTFLGAHSGVVAMGESATSLAFRIVDAVAGNVPGDNIVTTNLDHPAIYDSTKLISDRYGKQWRVAGLNPKSGLVDPEEILKHIDQNTTLLAMVHSSNNLGTKNDVVTTIREARKIKPDLFVLLDGSQHVSHCPVDVEEIGCDVYVFSTYKAFSKIGASFMYLSDRAARLPHDKLLGSADTNWELGTRDQSGYAAWSRVADYLCWLGGHFSSDSEGKRESIVAAMEAIEQHERALIHRVLRGADGTNGLLNMDHIRVYAEIDDLTVRGPVLAINIDGMSAGQVVTCLEAKGIRVTDRKSDFYSKHTLSAIGIEECVRVSLAHYNSPREVDEFLDIMRGIIR